MCFSLGASSSITKHRPMLGAGMDTRSRLRAHPNRKDAIASSVVDVVSLSACDEDMVQECALKSAEAMKRRHAPAGGHGRSKCQRNAVPRAPQSEHNSSQEILSELDELEELDGRSHLPTLKDPRRAQSCRFGESQTGGGSSLGSFGESLSSLSGSDGTSQPVDRPRTSDSLGTGPSSPHAFASPSAMGRVRSLRLVKSAALGANARSLSSLHSRCPSRMFLEASHRGLLSLSLSGASSSHGVAEVYEGIDLLVRCPAPRRPKRTNNAKATAPELSQDYPPVECSPIRG